MRGGQTQDKNNKRNGAIKKEYYYIHLGLRQAQPPWLMVHNPKL